MPRTSRITPGGMVFHVLNRGVGRQRLFDKPADYAAFEDVIEETLVVAQLGFDAFSDLRENMILDKKRCQEPFLDSLTWI
jgi:hypothetical protein